MKKILIAIAILCAVQASAQYTTINSRYEWLGGLFKALGLPAGDSARFQVGQSQRQGAVYLDTVNTAGSPEGFYIFRNGIWELQNATIVTAGSELIDGGGVTYKGTGYQYSVEAAIYRIDNVIYTSDSGSIELSTADPTYDRIDVLYVGTDGEFHILEGTPAETPAKPQVQADQIELTFFTVDAGSTIPGGLSQIFIYDENIEWTESHTSVTVDPDDTEFPWIGTKATEVTTINHGDIIYYTKPSGTVSLQGVESISMAIKLKAAMVNDAFISISFFANSVQVSNEINVNLNKSSLVYQTIAVPISQFTISNLNIDRLRIRYRRPNNTSAQFSGWWMDYIHLVSGIPPPQGGGGDVSITMPSAFNVVDNNDQFVITGAGTAQQYITGVGNLATYDALNAIGTVNSQTKSTNGATINGNQLVLQDVDDDYRGLMTTVQKKTLDTLNALEVQNLGDGAEIAVEVDAFTTGFKSLKEGTGVTLDETDSTIVINTSGGSTPTLQQVLTAGSTLTTNNTIVNDANTLTITGNTVSSNPIVSITSTSTAAASNTQKGLNVSLSGTNATSSQTTYAGYFINTHGGSGTNYGGYFLASTGSVNYGIKGEGTTQGVFGLSSNTGVYGEGTNITGVYGSSTGGNGLQGETTNGTGIQASSINGLAANLFINPSSTNTVTTIFEIKRFTSGTAANNIGGSIDYYIEADNGNSYISNQLISKFTTAANATRTSQLDITGVNSAATETYMNIQTGGIVRVNNNADTLATKAYARSVGGGGSSDITIGTTTITSGTNTRVLYNNSGVVGEYTISGTGNVAMTNTPQFSGNILLGGSSVATDAVSTLHIFNGTAPSASVTDGILLYSEDVSSSSELKVRDEAGNVTVLSPHNFSHIPGGPSEKMAWAFYSERDGTVINVDMLKLAREVEKLSGEKLVYIVEKTKQ